MTVGGVLYRRALGLWILLVAGAGLTPAVIVPSWLRVRPGAEDHDGATPWRLDQGAAPNVVRDHPRVLPACTYGLRLAHG
jgi:hypothetical protein